MEWEKNKNPDKGTKENWLIFFKQILLSIFIWSISLVFLYYYYYLPLRFIILSIIFFFGLIMLFILALFFSQTRHPTHLKWDNEKIHLKFRNGKVITVLWDKVKHIKNNGKVKTVGGDYETEFIFCYKTRFDINCYRLEAGIGQKLRDVYFHYANLSFSKCRAIETLIFKIIILAIIGIAIFTIWFWVFYV